MFGRVLSLLLVLCSLDANAADLATGPAAYQQPLADIAPQRLATFREGAGIFRQAWLAGPSTDTPRFTGLGPLFNRRSCIACHIGNGRGEPPTGASDNMRSILIRISLPGTDAHGAPKPHAVYGDQIQTDAVIGHAREAAARFLWHETPVKLDDGTTVRLRRPEIIVRDPNYGPLPADIEMSARISPAVFGLGLLEAVPADALDAMAREAKPDGVKGRVNMVWDITRKKAVPGRFGLKANQPDLRQQIAAALAGDMGITSSMILSQKCPPAAADCAKMGAIPEISDTDFETLARYMADLAPPPRRAMNAQAARGEKLFDEIGCAACHRETLDAGGRAIEPFTDLLLHDMGEGLADNRADFLATGREWRTAPLWGIGLAKVVNEDATFLHDGRARTLTEAILWHGGEAQAARDRFAKMSRELRDALTAFLETL